MRGIGCCEVDISTSIHTDGSSLVVVIWKDFVSATPGLLPDVDVPCAPVKKPPLVPFLSDLYATKSKSLCAGSNVLTLTAPVRTFSTTPLSISACARPASVGWRTPFVPPNAGRGRGPA